MKVIACRGIAFYTELSVAYKSAFSITNSTLWTKEINGWNEIEIYFDLRPTLNHWSLQRSISSQRNSVNVAVLYVTVYRCWVISMKFKDLRKATKKRLTIAHDKYLLDLLKTDDMDLAIRKHAMTKRFWAYIRSKGKTMLVSLPWRSTMMWCPTVGRKPIYGVIQISSLIYQRRPAKRDPLSYQPLCWYTTDPF